MVLDYGWFASTSREMSITTGKIGAVVLLGGLFKYAFSNRRRFVLIRDVDRRMGDEVWRMADGRWRLQ